MQISHCTQSITNSENIQISEMRNTWEMFWYQQSRKKYKLVLHRTVRAKTGYSILDGLKAALVPLKRFLSELQYRGR